MDKDEVLYMRAIKWWMLEQSAAVINVLLSRQRNDMSVGEVICGQFGTDVHLVTMDGVNVSWCVTPA